MQVGVHMSNIQFLLLSEVIEKSKLRKSSIYKKMNEGTFPKNIKISARKVVWKESDIVDWMNNQSITR